MEMTEGLVGTMLRESGTRAALIESNNGGRGFARAVQARRRFVWSGFTSPLTRKPASLERSDGGSYGTFPCDWALRWPELYAHLTTYRWKFPC